MAPLPLAYELSYRPGMFDRPNGVLASLFVISGLTASGCPSTNHDGGELVRPKPTSVPVAPIEPPPQGRLPNHVTPVSYALSLDIDPNKPDFGGRVSVTLEVSRPTRSFYLHGQDLRIKEATLDTTGGTRPVSVTPVAGKTLLAVDLGQAIGPGEHRLHISYEAPFASGLAGLYRVQAAGRWYAFTQFEPLDARRAFPCFDEPAFKRPFEIEVSAPADMTVIANTAEVSKEADGKRGSVRHRFKTTERLPTYLIAFAVGELDVVEHAPIAPTAVRPKPVPLRGIAVKGRGKDLGFALTETAGQVRDLEDYFGLAYPYDKLDIIAVPDFAAGAMENAGAITYRDSLLLVDDKSATETLRRDVVGISAHELAHQWFGNLVTMMWWDDIWLNEAFATWMGQRLIMKRYPQWNADLELLSWARGAMDADSLVSARKIRQPIMSDDDVDNAFDVLTYSKGAGLIAMFERFVGEEAFKLGVRRYLSRHRFGNATTDDFLSAVFAEDKHPGLAQAFRQYLDRPGVPLVELEVSCAAGKLDKARVRAQRYLPLGSSGDVAQSFELPLCARLGANTSCSLVKTSPKQATELGGVAGAPCPELAFANAGGTGYARLALGDKELAQVFGKPFAQLSPAERLAAVDALGASLRSGAANASAVLAALPAVTNDPLREVASSANELLLLIGDQLLQDADRAAFQRFVGDLFRARYKQLGFSGKPKESAETKLFRRDVVEMMALVARDKEVRKEALASARKVLGLGGSGKLDLMQVDSDLVTTTLSVGVQDGGAQVFDAVLVHLKQSEDAGLRRRFLSALASATDPALAARARALVLDPALKQSETFRFLFNQLEVRELRAESWKWLLENLDKVLERIPEGARSYLANALDPQCSSAKVAELRAALAPHLAKMTGAPRALDNAEERAKICEAIKLRQAPEVAKHLGKKR